jgi:phospholipase C
VRSFAGAVVAAGQDSGQVPRMAAALVPGTAPVVQLTLANDGNMEVVYSLTPNDYTGTAQTVHADVDNPVTVNWPTNSDGYHDVIITANTSDGFTRRYGGRIG